MTNQQPPQSIDLAMLGWDEWFADRFVPFAAEGCEPARVVLEHSATYRVCAAAGDAPAAVSGRFRHQAHARKDFPAVGDWVAIRTVPSARRAVIHATLPRRSAFSRKVAGHATEQQIVAANIDTVMLVNGLDRDFNPRRIERYLLMAWESGASPVILLTKADLCANVAERVAGVEAVSSGTPVHVLSSITGEGVAGLQPYLLKGRTVALLGSSGVGKSTLINRLLEEDRLRTGHLRGKDQRGRHTTMHRELIVLPRGGVVIDTPGMRELQLWDAGSALDDVFGDIDLLGGACHFRDCRHLNEPGCAVKQAVADGELQAERFESYQKLQRELTRLARQQDRLARLDEKKRVKALMKSADRHKPRG